MKQTALVRKTRLRSKPKPETKILDELLRKLVLLRDGFRCRKCGAGIKAGRGTALQAAHLFPKGQYPALRHEPLNVLTLCWNCHLGNGGWHKNPLDSWEWVRETLGTAFVEHLRFLAQTRSKVDKAAVRLYLESELARLEGQDSIRISRGQ